MDSEPEQLNIFFFPFMAHGHMIPLLDMAKLFSLKGAKPTIITTQYNYNLITKYLIQSKNSGTEIVAQIIRFPDSDYNFENLDQIDSFEETVNFFLATRLLQAPLEQLLEHHRPDCLIADVFFPWATDAAAKFEIPRIVFHGKESELKSYGVIANTFYELEPAYADHYRKIMGRKAWHVGPVSLCNLFNEDKAHRGQNSSIDEHECLKWLDSKKRSCVIYVCFGSASKFLAPQLREIAYGIEASGQDFIWVVRRLGVKKQGDGDEEHAIDGEKWLPEGFEERTKGKGLIIRGWAPQVLILDHESIGGFVTHCGWNSTLEGICAGVPMVTWPVFAEQFYNEKLITQILKIGVGVGAKEWTRLVGDSVKRGKIEEAVSKIMIGDEAEEMRNRAKGFAAMAKKAVRDATNSKQREEEERTNTGTQICG